MTRPPALLLFLAVAAALLLLPPPPVARADGWKDDSTWYDGLVEKAVYTASRVVYGKPRAYDAVFFTNKEQHDRKTLTKADKSKDTVEVWKHNQVEVIPTPNYDYKYVTTSHLLTGNLDILTRLDCSSQEFCGTSFKQYELVDDGKELRLDYWSFSYMPEAGRLRDTVTSASPPIAADSLPLWLRNYEFAAKKTLKIALLPSQKNNRPTDHKPVAATVRHAGTEDGLHKLELVVDGKVAGTYWMANDRLHVMVKYRGADGQQYDLKSLQRVDYWTRKE